MNKMLESSIVRVLAAALAITASATSARANVYATDIKLNGATNNVSIAPGGNINISYILNEPASAGVSIKILIGNTAVRTIAIPAGNNGALRGLNSVAWNGKNDLNANAAGGSYSISITAAASGYSDWTQITQDTNVYNAVFMSRGMDVNKNTNSFYYGRIYVGNETGGANTVNPNGDLQGVQKLNADASPGDEGGFSDGGFSWSTGFPGYAPWRVKVGPDDRVYMEDWSGNGNIYSWDPQVTPGSILAIMRDDNNPFPEPAPPAGPINYQGVVNANPPHGNFGAIAVTGGSAGTNNSIWMGDNNTGGWGVVQWSAQPNGTLATNLAPNLAVRATASAFGFTNSDLDDSVFDFDIGRNGNIYIGQQPYNDNQLKIFCFPPYTGTPLTNSIWKTGGTLSSAYDVTAIAVNPGCTYVAVALGGVDVGVLILDAARGTNITTVSMDNGNPNNAVAWDNVGNLYNAFDDINGFDGGWRCWSPPGTNQATTVALEKVTVSGAAQPLITSITVSGSSVTIQFTGATSDSASAFTLQSSSAAAGTYSNVTATPAQISPGAFQVVTTTSGPARFYRIKR